MKRKKKHALFQVLLAQILIQVLCLPSLAWQFTYFSFLQDILQD